MSKPIDIPDEVLIGAYTHARMTFPDECCGWLTGPKDGNGVNGVRRCGNQQANGQHPTAAGLPASVAYTMSEEDVSALADSLKSDMPAKIVFHSHPNMQAFFSAIDVEVATSPFDDGPTLPVQQLVIGLSEDRIHSAKLFAWSDEEHTFVQIAQYAGATL